MDNTFLDNLEFLERHIRENPDEFWNAHIDDGKIILLTICKVHGYMYEFASKKLKADKDIIETALSSCGEILEKVPLIYRFEPYYVNLAVCNNGLALRFAPWVLQNDKDIVLKACNNNGKAFLFASKRLKNDKDVAYIACKTYEKAVYYFGDDLINDKNFMDKLRAENKKIAEYMDKNNELIK